MVLNQCRTPSAEATVKADGKIVVGEIAYGTPSAAAKAVIGSKGRRPGWNRWRVPRLGGSRLIDIENANEAHELAAEP